MKNEGWTLGDLEGERGLRFESGSGADQMGKMEYLENYDHQQIEYDCPVCGGRMIIVSGIRYWGICQEKECGETSYPFPKKEDVIDDIVGRSE